VLNSLGGVLQRLGRFDEAVDAFQRSYALLVEQGDDRGQAMVLNSLGGVLQRLGRFDEAVDAFQRSIAIGEALRDRRHLAMAHTSLGKALLSQDRGEAAVVELSEGFQYDEGLKNGRGLGFVAPVLIQVLSRLGRQGEALDYCQRALAIAPQNKDLRELHGWLLSSESTRKQGVVKCILQNALSGRYGFVTLDDGSADVYFREGRIDSDCWTNLAKGVRVEVEVEQGPKGPRARSLRIIT
jgi:tetratricopeptide (TPR) repeat protein